MSRKKVKAFLKKVEDRKSRCFDDLRRLCRRGAEINIQRNKLVIALTKIYAEQYLKEKKRCQFFSTFVQKQTDIKLGKRILAAFNLLFKNFDSIEFFLNNCVKYPQNYALSEETFLLFIKKNVHVASEKCDLVDEDEKDEPLRKKQKQKQKPKKTIDTTPLENNFIDYDSKEYSLPVPPAGSKFIISLLGERSFTGHQHQLKNIKQRCTQYTFPPDHGLALVGDNAYHFEGAEKLPLDKKHGITEFLNPLSQRMVENFSYSFNSYFRDTILPNRRVQRIFVAKNWLHDRPGIGFFCVLDDNTIYHTCCGRGCDKDMVNHYKP